MNTCTKEKQYSVWFLIGMAAVLVMAVPYLLLKGDSIVVYHDQLDGELMAYILGARHLFSGNSFPEFMGGMAKTSLIPPAPAAVLLFRILPPFAAYVVLQVAGSLMGYIGMYLLAVRFRCGGAISMVVAVCYGYLPFLPVYGLAQYGLPLLLWMFLEAREGRRNVAACVYAAVYAMCSSLVLVGFAVLAASAIFSLISKRRKLWAAWTVLLGVYVAENLSLLAQMLGIGEGGLSHKAEYTLGAEPFFRGFWKNFAYGGQHSEDGHLGILLLTAALALLTLLLVFREKKRGTIPDFVKECLPLYICGGWCLGINALLALVAAIWDGVPGVAVRKYLGALGAFQMNRVLWMAPCLWYLLLLCDLAIVVKMLTLRRVACVAAGFAALVTAGATGVWVLAQSNLKPNLQKLVSPDVRLISYNDYYAVGVLEQVQEYIRENTGMEPCEYRVVSLGIDPAAALYHGFYCLDGYSNNYSLEYKHRFRKVLEPELQKSEYLREYFDGWGNRCYLFSSECPGYYTVEKNGFYYQNYEVDTEALQDLGADYLLSAAYIWESEKRGLKLLREEPFETQNSYYRIFIYQVGE